MSGVIAYATLALTVTLAVTRPRLGSSRFRFSPGAAATLGVVILFGTGLLRAEELWLSAKLQWRPLVTLTCIMLMTGVVKEVGAFDRLAFHIEARARSSSALRAFDLIFWTSVVTPAVLNNDAAILLLTPVVVTLARRVFPDNGAVLEAFAFAVFLAPGVAPFIISNPMNLVVAEFAGLGFNSYAAVMAPISLVGALLTFVVLRTYYRRALLAARPSGEASPEPERHPAERPALGFLLVVFLSYPVVAALDGPMWPVAVTGALGAISIAFTFRIAPARRLAGHVSFDILFFLWGVFLVVAGLRSVGVVEQLTEFYAGHRHHEGVHLGLIGVISALGSALVDNHPMALLNMMALEQEGARPLLAALVGGDIGPRLLPIGSLAGLLWLDLLRRRGIDIGIGKFMRLGTLVLIPTLSVSLLMLWLM